MFYIILAKNWGLSSVLLRFLMWSRFSHSAVFDQGSGLVYDATMFPLRVERSGWKIRIKTRGVRATPYEQWLRGYTQVRELFVSVDKGSVPFATKWLETQVGKPYDTSGIYGFLFRRDWQEDDQWFCSEMSESFRSLFSYRKFNTHANRITPHHQDIVA